MHVQKGSPDIQKIVFMKMADELPVADMDDCHKRIRTRRVFW